MDAASSVTILRRTVGMAYKIILTLVAGSILAAIGAAYFHYRAVQDGMVMAERLVGQGELAKANAIAFQMAFEPRTAWARCFPGYFRTFGKVRIRCLVRTGQADAAREVAEALRLYDDEPLVTDPVVVFFRSPPAWLHKMGTAFVANFTAGFFPAERPGVLSGYETLFAELVAIRDTHSLETLAADLARQFPQLPLGIYANSARGEVDPVPPPASSLSPSAGPERVQRPPDSATPQTQAPATTAVENIPAPPPPPEQPASWGIVTSRMTVASNPDGGQPVRQLKAGDVLVIEGSIKRGTKSLLTGTLILNNRNVTNLAFNGGDLEIFNGDFNKVSPEEVALRSKLAEIVIQEAALVAQEKMEKESMPPEEKAFNKAEERMAAFQKDSKDLQARLEKTTGNERIAILDRLRLMKYEEQAIVRDLQKKKDAMEAALRASGRPRTESPLPALRQEKQAILKRLAQAAP